MRLTAVEVIPYALPFRRPYVTARGTLTRREMVLLRLRTDEGIEGLGEAVPLSLRGGATLAQVVRELEEVEESRALHDLIDGGHLEYSSSRVLDPRLTLSLPSQCAVLTALDDMRAKWAGDRYTPASVRCNATLIAGEPLAVAEDAIAWQEEGFSTFKLKLGTGNDLELVRAVREVVGPIAKVRVDANAAWEMEEARRVLTALQPLGIELAEQPMAAIEDCAALAELVIFPLAGDESITTLEEARLAAGIGAFQVTGIKLSKVGGYSAALNISEALPAYVSSALDGPVGIAAGAALAGALDDDAELLGWPQRAHGLATQRLFASTIASVECELIGGTLYPPPGPGLGIVIDEDALQAHRI
ncbi:MAG TPA: mandelate racemase/muconate lactonizing enzyme family protein [Solirubrobacterales bacterium]|nr:mandelate racemase/muconate lactonizing enzyme family protein [Solirubrobacterales bacterium]